MATTVGKLKDLGVNVQEIYSRLFDNKELCKLVYYLDMDPLAQPDVPTPTSTLKDYIKFVPMIGSNETTETKIIFVLNGGKKISSNTEYQTVSMAINIYTPLVSWYIKDSNFRPIAILSRIIETLDGKTIKGLGTLRCGDFDLALLTEEVCCYTLSLEITLNA